MPRHRFLSECEFTFHTHNVSLGRPCLYLYHKGFRDFEVGKGGGGGGGGGKWRVLKLLKSSVIATFLTISEVGAGSPSLVASQLTNDVIGLCAGCLSEFLSLGLRRFLSHFFVFTWVMRPYSVTVHYLLFTVYCALSWQLVSWTER